MVFPRYAFIMDEFAVPRELSEMFTPEHFENYPLVKVPQAFVDERGSIRNIADGMLGDVAIIDCEEGSVRASHLHLKDWHLTYLISGLMTYYWTRSSTSSEILELEVSPGQLVISLPGEPHKMFFRQKSCFVAVSAFSRLQKNYEEDTVRMPNEFFG